MRAVFQHRIDDICALTGYIEKAKYEGLKQEGRTLAVAAQTIVSEHVSRATTLPHTQGHNTSTG
jgi:hypothetical protein